MLSVELATDQRSSNACYNCTRQAGPYQPAAELVTNICSMQIPYSRVDFSVDTLHSISIFVNFIHPSSWLFSIYWFKKGLYFDQTLCHVFKWCRPFSIPCHLSLHLLRKYFTEVGIENNMILWHYQIWPKVVWKVHGAWIDGYDSQYKDKIITITKHKSQLFFPCSVSKQNHLIPHRVICAILDIILNILQRWKNNNNMLVKFSRCNWKLSENSY